MGQPLSIIATLFIFSGTIQAGCIAVDPLDEKSMEACPQLTGAQCVQEENCEWASCVVDTTVDMGGSPRPSPHACVQHKSYQPCSEVLGCEWLMPPSLTMVQIKTDSKELAKYLPPIEAFTEYIGDCVYYEQLIQQMPKIYGHNVLENAKKDNFKITKVNEADYHPVDKVITEYIDDTMKRFPSLKGDETKDDHVIKTLLQYSRPLLHTESLLSHTTGLSKMTKETFTLSAAVSIADIAWWDALAMNPDRFMFNKRCKWCKANTWNMMLYEKKVDSDEGSRSVWVYVPIDQGLATPVTMSWFKWIVLQDKEEAYRHYGIPIAQKEFGWKQIIFSNEGFKELKKSWWASLSDSKDAPWSKYWKDWYKAWLKKDDKAKEFVDNNLNYFPQFDEGDKAFKQKLIDVIGTVWRIRGGELCNKMGESIEKVFEEINDNSPDIKTMLKSTKMLKPTKRGWKVVQSVIREQITACINWYTAIDQTDEKHRLDVKNNNHIESQRTADIDLLFKDFVMADEKEVRSDFMEVEARKRRSTIAAYEILKTRMSVVAEPEWDKGKAKGKAKQIQYDDALYLDDVDSKDVGQDIDEQYDDNQHDVYYADPDPLSSDKYYWNDFMMGGLFGSASVIVVILVFCIGGACGMISCWGYRQYNDLEKDEAEALYCQESEEDI